MNRLGLICRYIYENPCITQRELSQELQLSLGSVNHLIKECAQNGFLELDPEESGRYHLLPKGSDFLEQFRVDGAVIMAAGFGSRFVPLTFETPKGLLEVFGERMIERQIKQLHEAGIRNITIVVGYLKEKFEYLIDRYGVDLLYNREYSAKNTLASLYRAHDVLKGRSIYLLSSDNWMRSNMFHSFECGSWYSAVYMEGETSEWCLDFTKKGQITRVQSGGRDCWAMYGPAYLAAEDMDRFLPVLEAYYHLPGTEQFYWEQVLLELWNGTARQRLNRPAEPPHMFISRQPADQVYEFENLEELRTFDPKYQNHSDSLAMQLVSQVFEIPESEVTNIRCLKAGMTNRSFLFTINSSSYICRIPGAGTELLINRRQEADVYEAIRPLGITEHILYLNRDTGYKIAEYYQGARNANPESWPDMQSCMDMLRKLHGSNIQVAHSFDIRERIEFYEKLCKSCGSILFEDYDAVRGTMNKVLDWLDQLNRPQVLAHIDSVADNFIFLPDGSLRLIDWEYAGMCDAFIDIAMSAVYSYYNEEQALKLLCMYLGREPHALERNVYYAYISLGGFLWSLWAVYKSALGDEFGEYTIIMYRYGKTFAKKLLNQVQA